MRINAIHESIKFNQITLKWISTHDNIADILTQQIAGTRFLVRPSLYGQVESVISPRSRRSSNPKSRRRLSIQGLQQWLKHKLNSNTRVVYRYHQSGISLSPEWSIAITRVVYRYHQSGLSLSPEWYITITRVVYRYHQRGLSLSPEYSIAITRVVFAITRVVYSYHQSGLSLSPE
jgi:hypothetical protein